MGFAIDSSAASWRTNLLHKGTEAGYGARLENSPVPDMAHDQLRCAGSHLAPATTRRCAGPHRRTGERKGPCATRYLPKPANQRAFNRNIARRGAETRWVRKAVVMTRSNWG